MQDPPGQHKPPPPAAVARHPAVPVALFFLAGIALHAKLPTVSFVWLWFAAAATVLAVVARPRPFIASTLLCLAWLAAGVLAGQLASFRYPADHIGLYASDDSRLAQLELALDDPPRVITNPFDQRQAVAPKQVALARVVRVRTTAGGWRAASGEVLLQINDPHPRLAAGQIVRATGLLQRPAPAMNPGQFDCTGSPG